MTGNNGLTAMAMNCRFVLCALLLVGGVLSSDQSSVKSQDKNVTVGKTLVSHNDGLEGGAPSSDNSEHDERYHVFNFEFEPVKNAYIVSLWIFFASVAKIVFHLNNKLSSIFPESCLLIIIGIIVGIIVYFSTPPGGTGSLVALDAVTFFHFLLPPIILDAGYFMPNRAFFNNIGTILLYAVVGTLWNTGSIGVTLWGFSKAGWLSSGEVDILQCLVFSSLISAVDPVAVLATFEEIHVNEQLHIVVFGESLLNDAVTVVLYHMFLEYSLQDEVLLIDIGAGVLQFFIVGIGGTLIGVIFGLLCAFITKYTSHVRVIEPIFVFLLAYLGYLTAEMFHLSGIMALTFCGIVMKQYVVFNISEKSQTTIKYFLKMLSSMTETVIFMMLGTSTIQDNHSWDFVFIIVTIVSCLVYRAVGVLGLTWLANKQRLSKLSIVDQFVMAYGGLRGAIAFALAILLIGDKFKHKDLFVTTTILVVMFTVFVQGTTIKPLVNALKVRKRVNKQTTMNEQIHERLLDHTMAAIEDITGYHGNHWLRDKWEFYNNNYFSKWLLREKPQTTERAIMRVHSKLSLRDAMDQATSGRSNLQVPNFKNEPSLLRMIKNWSVSSFQDTPEIIIYPSSVASDNELPHNDTVVDMQALDAHYSKKIADDMKTHHMLSENILIAPSRRMTKHVKHKLADNQRQKKYFHHNVKLHLRHMISKHSHMAEERRKQKHAEKVNKVTKLPKNVSFARVDQNHLTLPQSSVHFDQPSEDEEEGITFTVISPPSDDDTIEGREEVFPVALECELPWKRSSCVQESEPICSLSTHQLPDDNRPELACVPSWADNLDYHHLSALSPRSDAEALSPGSDVKAGSSDTDHLDRVDTPEHAGKTPSYQEPTNSKNPLIMVTKPNPSIERQRSLQFNSSTEDSQPTGSTASVDEVNADVNAGAPYISINASSDEEEVPIRPFGNLKINTSFPHHKNGHRENSQCSDLESSGSDPPGGVKFSLSNYSDSE